MRKRPQIEIAKTTAADLPELMSLWNDGRVMRWVGFPDGLGYDEAKIGRWFAGISAKPDRHHWIARSPDVGFCGELYAEIDREHRRVGLDVKFRPEAQGGGRSTAALRAVIDRVFESEPEIDAVWTEPSEENLAARTLYFSCGLRAAERPAYLEPYPSYWELTRKRWEEGRGK